ncbi:MAG: hypothetical protein ACPGQR_04190 [Marinirhabdus sp.]
MKNLTVILLLCASTAMLAQSQDSAIFGAPTNSLGLNTADEGTIIVQYDLNKIQGFASLTDFDDIVLFERDTEGSIYLFNQWNQAGSVVVKGKSYVFNNMNYNVRSDVFSAKIPGDSVFNLTTSILDRVVIGGKTFKSYVNPKSLNSEVYEVVYEGEDYSILKNYGVRIVEPNPNPMINRSRRQIKKTYDYFIKTAGSFKPFKLKKSDILELVGDRKGEVKAYALENKLSFREEKDVKKLLQHAQGI